MTTDRVNNANTVLILIAAAAAFVAPFEVFLLAYMVLGPLHYLTEMSWLSDRKCFLSNRRDCFPLLFLCAAILVVPIMPWPQDRKSDAVTMINFVALAGAGVLVFARTAVVKVMSFALIVATCSFAVGSHSWRIIFGPLLPTIIHVFFFTGGFILLGALRGRSKSAVVSLAVLMLCSVSFFWVPLAPRHALSEYVRDAYVPFEHLNWIVMSALGLTPSGSGSPLHDSPQGLAVMRFIAFIYLHHYLNWFSKVSIIKWNRISSRRSGTIGALWLISLWMYAHNQGAHSMLLAALSYGHGFLEMPLDHRTFRAVGSELRALFGERFGVGSSRDLKTDRRCIATT
jgi:hypothetical protein